MQEPPIPGINPIKLPKKEHLSTSHLFAMKSLNPLNQPEASNSAFSEIALFYLNNSTISGNANIEIAITIKWSPLPKYITIGV